MAGQLRALTTRSTPSTISYNVPASLAKRLLFPQLAPGSDLPPLFLSRRCPRELDEEIYDFIALALRAFVNTWWTKLTRYDKEFLPQITTILIHLVRALERRLLDADLSLLVFSDIPALVTQHYMDYRQAASKASTSYATGGALSLPQVFHQLQSHIAISSDGTLDEEYFRQAVDHILRECLPPEDYAPEAERFIVREIILKVVIKDVIPRITQPWFLHKMVLDMVGPCPNVSPEQSAVSSASSQSRWSKSSTIVLLLSAIQRMSGMCIMFIHAYKQVIHIIPIVNSSCLPTRAPARIDESVPGPPSIKDDVDLTRGLLVMISEVLRVQDRHAATALVHISSLFCCSFQTFMNKLLYYVLYSYVLSASTLLSVVRLSKRMLFPNGYPGPPAVDPTDEEQAVIRDEVVKRLSDCVPGVVGRVLLGDGTVEDVVGGVSDARCNRHLAVFVLDAILLRVFPEMGS